jgi:hypothetical protein
MGFMALSIFRNRYRDVDFFCGTGQEYHFARKVSLESYCQKWTWTPTSSMTNRAICLFLGKYFIPAADTVKLQLFVPVFWRVFKGGRRTVSLEKNVKLSVKCV